MYGEIPVHRSMNLVRINVLDPNFQLIDNLSLDHNKVVTKDDYFQIGQNSFVGEFYTVSINILSSKIIKEMKPHGLFTSQIWLNSLQMNHYREIYHFLDVLGDLGGVLEILILVCSAVCMSFSEHSFTL